MANYCTLAEVKANLPETLGSSTDTTYDSLINTLITSASRVIDGYLGQEDDYFYPSTDTEVRYYNGNNDFEIVIDDFLSVSELAVAEEGVLESTGYTVWSSTNYYLEPYNASAKSKPYHKITVDMLNGDKYAFPNFKKAVRVTGIFGYSTSPPVDVTQAAMMLVIRQMQRAKNAYQDAGANPGIGQMFYITEIDPDVKMMLKKYVMENL
jgi:hypothetical protein